VEPSDFVNNNDNFKDVTFVVVPDTMMITPRENVIVTITKHSDNVIYDGEEHTVTGYDFDSNDPLYIEDYMKFNGVEADSTAKGTAIGSYGMNFDETFFENINENFKNVTFVVNSNDSLVIEALKDVIVTITKHADVVTYDGVEHTVSGYDFESSSPLYTEEFVRFLGTESDTIATGTNVGKYGMNFDETFFQNINENFSNVTFVVKEADSLVIEPKTGVVITITGHSDKITYDGEEHTIEGYDVEISDPLYNEADIIFSGNASVSATEVGTYKMELTSDDFTNGNSNFADVTFVVNETDNLVISPRENIVVTIIPHSDTVKYTSSQYKVTGYDVIIPDPMYQESDIIFTGVAETSGTTVGVYPMELTSDQFANNNKNFNVVFDVKEGGLVITQNDTIIVYVHEHGDEVVYDGQRHEVTEFHYTFNNEFCRVGKVKRDRTKKYIVEGTEVGVYQWTIQESYFTYDDENFINVKFVIIPDSLVILPRTDVEVTIIPNTDTFTYDGEMHTVTHYTIESSDSLFTEQDLIFHGVDTLQVTDAGTYEMNISATDFESVNPNFGHVTFVVKEGQKTVVEPMRGVEVVISTHGDSIAYDGTAHTVSGFEVEANSDLYKREFIDFTGDSTITATEVGEYTMILNPAEFANNNKNFEDVTFIINSDNKLVIESLDGVQVVLKKHGAVVSYNGQPQTVSGYDLISISDTLYHAEDFSFIGTAADTIATRTTIGTAVMSLSADDFQNNNATFDDVRFIILEDTLTVVPNDHEVIVIREGAKLVPFDGQEHMVTGYTLVSSTDGAYTTSCFTFSGCDTVRGKEVGAYSMNLKAEDFTNIDTNYVNVTFVIEEDSLAIVPLQSIVVTIYEHADTFTFNGKEQIVSGYDIESSISYYDAKDFKFVGDSIIKKVNAGEYKMNLKTSDFINTNENFTDVTFHVVPAVTKILPKETLHVTIYGNIDSVYYNGGFQEVKGYTWKAEEGFEFYKEFKFTGNDVAKGVKIGDYYMGLTSSNFKNTSSNYVNVIFEIEDGYLHIDRVPIPIIVSANTGSKIYDGKEYQNTGYSYTRNALQTGDRITAVIQGRITNVGTVENRVVSYKIVRGSEDVTANYNFGTAVHGTLTILPRTVVLTSADSTKLYDGTPLTQDSIRIEADGWAEGEGADIQITGKQLEVGESQNTFTYELWENTDLHNYEIETVYGTLTVTSNTDEVIIAAANDTFLYDGKEHSSNHYRIVSGYIGQGDSLIVDVEGVITEAGKAANKVVGYRVVRGAMDVTDYYTFGTPVDGTLLVQKRKVTLISGSAEREYNGEELTNDTIFVEGDGWAEGEGAVYTVTGSRLYPGDTANKFTYELDANTLAKNYTITKREGKLTVLMNTQVLDITAASATKMYDGTPLEDSSFTYTEGILAEGDILYVTIEGSITEVGVDTNRIVDYRIMRGDMDVTDFYTIGEVNNGILRVEQDLHKLPFVLVGKDHSIEMYNVNSKVRVYDMLGRLVKINGAFEVEVGNFYNVEVMNAGVYVVVIDGHEEGYKVIVR
ncbi:MAG: T9SS type A sorting domain-containing protein, partial [Paludibacteraceae bacterium]|nr:T9SS type A sorting domain-containing protein [Paludibacteraceae bacterium]